MLSLQSRHTFALPVMARDIIEIEKAEQLTQIDFNVPFMILGEGSNTVFLNDYSGLVISMKNKVNAALVALKETGVSYILMVQDESGVAIFSNDKTDRLYIID